MLLFFERPCTELWRMISKLKLALNALLHLVYPRQCLFCSWDLLHFEEVICTHCKVELPRAFPFLVHPQMKKVFFGRCDFHQLIVGYKMEKTGIIKELMHALKYRQHPEVGQALGKSWAMAMKNSCGTLPWDVIVPVPLHPDKFKKRGYNQAEEIAVGLSEAWNISVSKDVLIRRTNGVSQTFQNRWIRNSKNDNPFGIAKGEALANLRVLVIDDVITTGATLVQCYDALKEIPGIKISFGALAIPVHNRIVV